MWEEDPDGDYDIGKDNINTQFVKVFFIDIDKDVEAIGEEIVDAKLPYDRIQLTTNETFVVTQNHMVGLCLVAKRDCTHYVGTELSDGIRCFH